jgi:hypothetical protein
VDTSAIAMTDFFCAAVRPFQARVQRSGERCFGAHVFALLETDDGFGELQGGLPVKWFVHHAKWETGVKCSWAT